MATTTSRVHLKSTDRSNRNFLRLEKMKIVFVFAVLAFDPSTILSLHRPLFPLGGESSGRLTAACSPPSAALFAIHNNRSYPVWAASIPGGGRRLNQSEIWMIDSLITSQARIWARTNCIFNSSGGGRCQTGDCGGLLRCQSNGTPPNTVAEFTLNAYDERDLFYISLVEGFNVQMQIKPSSGNCSQSTSCATNITGECPSALRAPGGCNSACMALKTENNCCRSSSPFCGPTSYTRFSKRNVQIL